MFLGQLAQATSQAIAALQPASPLSDQDKRDWLRELRVSIEAIQSPEPPPTDASKDTSAEQPEEPEIDSTEKETNAEDTAEEESIRVLIEEQTELKKELEGVSLAMDIEKKVMERLQTAFELQRANNVGYLQRLTHPSSTTHRLLKVAATLTGSLLVTPPCETEVQEQT